MIYISAIYYSEQDDMDKYLETIGDDAEVVKRLNL